MRSTPPPLRRRNCDAAAAYFLKERHPGERGAHYGAGKDRPSRCAPSLILRTHGSHWSNLARPPHHYRQCARPEGRELQSAHGGERRRPRYAQRRTARKGAKEALLKAQPRYGVAARTRTRKGRGRTRVAAGHSSTNGEREVGDFITIGGSSLSGEGIFTVHMRKSPEEESRDLVMGAAPV